LLYELTAAEEDFAPHHSSARFTEADRSSVRKQYDQAIPIYQRLATSTDAAEHAEALYALGRSLRSKRRRERCVAKKQLDGAARVSAAGAEPSSRITLGMLPSDLLALSEIASNGSREQRLDASLVLYRGLVGGQWRLDKVIYSHQSEQVIGWLPQNEETRALREQKCRSWRSAGR
jgi:hypothetical protein